MKIPGLFTKAAKHHRFEYKPRYYDPKKEEHDAREERVRQELANEKGDTPEEGGTPYDYRVRMKGAFQAARRKPQTSDGPNVAILRTGIILLIVLLFIGYLQWGGKVVYVLFFVFPIWIYLRFFKKRQQ